jgi:heterodisulfide reductase subunit B
MSTKETVALSIAARNLAIAERMGQSTLVVPCSACFTVLKKTNRYLREKDELRDNVQNALKTVGLEYNLSVRVRHPLDVLVNDFGVNQVKSKSKRTLQGFKVANYYGCQMVRPEPDFEDVEEPHTMDDLFGSLGAECVYFPHNLRCCGGMLMTTFREEALKLNRGILQNAIDNGAEMILTTCPLCQVNLEAYQDKISEMFGDSYEIPIFFFTQILGLALGCNPKKLGLERLLILPERLKQRLVQASS